MPPDMGGGSPVAFVPSDLRVRADNNPTQRAFVGSPFGALCYDPNSVLHHPRSLFTTESVTINRVPTHRES